MELSKYCALHFVLSQSGLLAQDDGCCDADGRHEGMCASIVTGVDAPPVLEPAERIFDLVPFAREKAVMFDRLCAVELRWDAGRVTRTASAWRNQSAS